MGEHRECVVEPGEDDRHALVLDQEAGQCPAGVAKYAGRPCHRLNEGHVSTPELTHQRAAAAVQDPLPFRTRQRDVLSRRRMQVAAPEKLAEYDPSLSRQWISAVDTLSRARCEDLQAGTKERRVPISTCLQFKADVSCTD